MSVTECEINAANQNATFFVPPEGPELFVPQEAYYVENPSSDDPHRDYVRYLPAMIAMARHAAQYDAFSYRDRPVHVGNATMVHDGSGNTAIISDGNWKLNKAFPKLCAETSTLKRAVQLGFTHAIGNAVVSNCTEEEIKDITFNDTPTLHMCDPCIDIHDESSIVDDDFNSTTAALDHDGYQSHTLAELKELSAERSPATDKQQGHHHIDNDFALSKWSERRVALYDFMTAAQNAYGTRETPAQIARYALTAAIL